MIENLFSATSEANVYLDKKRSWPDPENSKQNFKSIWKHLPTKVRNLLMVEFVCDPLPRNLVLATQFLATFHREPPNSRIVLLPARQIFSFLLYYSIQTTQSLVEIWRRADARSWKRDGGPVIWCQKYSNNCYHGLSSSNTKIPTQRTLFVDRSISRWSDFDWPSINESWRSCQLSPHPPIELIESSATSKKTRRWVKAASVNKKTTSTIFGQKLTFPHLVR